MKREKTGKGGKGRPERSEGAKPGSGPFALLRVTKHGLPPKHPVKTPTPNRRGR